MFSVGVLYSIQKFLGFVRRNPDLDLSFPNIFPEFAIASPKEILDTSLDCKWVIQNNFGNLVVTERRFNIIDCLSPVFSLRFQIGDLIERKLPPWLPLLSRGRAEAQEYLPPDVKQCFLEAGLLSTIDDNIVRWWDKYSNISRIEKNAKNVEIGRFGEKTNINT